MYFVPDGSNDICADGASDSVHLDITHNHLLHNVEHRRNLLISPVPLYQMDTREIARRE